MTTSTARGANASTFTPRSSAERLLLACARPDAVTKPSDELAEVATRPNLPWAQIAELARWQGVTPRLSRALVVSGVGDDVPERLGERLQSAYFATMARNLALRQELERVVGELTRHRIDVICLKGAVLTAVVHRDVGVRPLDDLDLLVHRDDLVTADRVLKALGYMPAQPPPAAVTRATTSDTDSSHHHLPALVRPDGVVTIELHHALGSSYTPLDFDVSGLWARAVPFRAGASPCLRLSDEDLLAHVCLHFLVDRVLLFSRRALGQLCDIAAIIDTFADTLDWNALAHNATATSYAPHLALALYTALAIQESAPPPDLRSALPPAEVHGVSVDELIARRVLRNQSWTTLEQLTVRTPSWLQLLPPRPSRWNAQQTQPRASFGMLEAYAQWARAATRVALRRGEIAEERRFATALQDMTFPHGLPEGTVSRWSKR